MSILNTLVKVENGKCSARELVKALEFKTTKSFESIFEKYVKEDNKYRFKNGVDFTIIPTRIVVNNGGYKEVNDYSITVDMAKHICLLTGTDKAFEIREYFIDCEKYIIETNQMQMFRVYRSAEAKEHSVDHEGFNEWECKKIDSAIFRCISCSNNLEYILQKDELLTYDNEEVCNEYTQARIFAYNRAKKYKEKLGKLPQSKITKDIQDYFMVEDVELMEYLETHTKRAWDAIEGF